MARAGLRGQASARTALGRELSPLHVISVFLFVGLLVEKFYIYKTLSQYDCGQSKKLNLWLLRLSPNLVTCMPQRAVRLLQFFLCVQMHTPMYTPVTSLHFLKQKSDISATYFYIHLCHLFLVVFEIISYIHFVKLFVEK